MEKGNTSKLPHYFSLLLYLFIYCKSENTLHNCLILHLNWINYFIAIDLLHYSENKTWNSWQKYFTNVIMLILQHWIKSTVLCRNSFICLLFPSVSTMKYFTLWWTIKDRKKKKIKRKKILSFCVGKSSKDLI